MFDRQVGIDFQVLSGGLVKLGLTILEVGTR